MNRSPSRSSTHGLIGAMSCARASATDVSQQAFYKGEVGFFILDGVGLGGVGLG